VNGNPETKNDPTGHAGVDPSDPFIQYVGAWYKYIHPLSHVWTNEFEIPNSAMPKSDFRGWARNYDTGTPNSVGRPDIVSLSEINGTFTVWEVKTSGLKINDRGKDFTTSEYTLGLGQAEAFWYANRAAREADNGWVTGKMGRWQVGSETNDVSIGLAMQLCGGVCRITFADGMIMEVKVASQGVLNYKIVKRPYGGVSIYPVVEAVMDREGKFDIRGELWKGLIKYYAPQPQ
jgi:hypothetical protein